MRRSPIQAATIEQQAQACPVGLAGGTKNRRCLDSHAPPKLDKGMALSLVDERKFSLKEAAKLAGVSESMMRLEVQRGEIPVIKIGVKAMLIEKDLEMYLRRHYVVEGSVKPRPVECNDLPAWVQDSPLLKPLKKAS